MFEGKDARGHGRAAGRLRGQCWWRESGGQRPFTRSSPAPAPTPNQQASTSTCLTAPPLSCGRRAPPPCSGAGTGHGRRGRDPCAWAAAMAGTVAWQPLASPAAHTHLVALRPAPPPACRPCAAAGGGSLASCGLASAAQSSSLCWRPPRPSTPPSRRPSPAVPARRARTARTAPRAASDADHPFLPARQLRATQF